jgi:isochorismate hydrolase
MFKNYRKKVRQKTKRGFFSFGLQRDYMDRLGILEREGAVFVLVDIQEKFVPAMSNIEGTIKNAGILVETSKRLGIPLLVTEQYPKGLGHTSGKISIPESAHIIEKTSFGCFGCSAFVEKIGELKPRQMVLFGLESHICVLKTALEALKMGIEVHAVADAICSRKEENKYLGIERMKQSGVFIVPAETVLFQLMDDSGSEEFMELRKLIL